MARRHGLREGDWPSVFGRLLELVMASTGADPFEEVFRLVVARAYAEQEGEPFGGTTARAAVASVERLLRRASRRWPDLVEPGPGGLPAETLWACVEVLGPLGLGDDLEGLDAAFEVLVSRTARGAKGQFFTPRHVVEACVRAVAPRPGETVLDPACGSGGFLLHAHRHTPGLREQGQDLDPRACRVASLLTRVAGADAQVRCGDSLQGKGDQGPVDVILTNPPFAGEVRDPSLLGRYELAVPGRQVERDALFLERCVRGLRAGGRMAVIVPSNKVASGRWAYLRRWLLSRARVVAVLGLGRHTFLPHTHQQTSVIFALRRPRAIEPPADEPVLFASSERDGKDSRGQPSLRPGAAARAPAWERLDHDLDQFVERFGRFVDQHQIPWGAAPCASPR